MKEKVTNGWSGFIWLGIGKSDGFFRTW